MAIKNRTLRLIATTELDKIFPGMAPEPREELITSVVRQWLTCDRHAGVFTIPVHYWLHLVERDEQVLAGVEVVPGSLPVLLGPWLVVERDLPRIVWELSVAQNATFVNAEGVTVRVRADAREHGFGVEEVQEEDGEE
jgi:hypothetical protein